MENPKLRFLVSNNLGDVFLVLVGLVLSTSGNGSCSVTSAGFACELPPRFGLLQGLTVCPPMPYFGSLQEQVLSCPFLWVSFPNHSITGRIARLVQL